MHVYVYLLYKAEKPSSISDLTFLGMVNICVIYFM